MTKKLLICVALVFAAFVCINNFAPDAADFEYSTVQKAAAPFRYAALFAREPEAKINIPIRKIKVRQIADTFAAPRRSDRRHQGQDIFAPRNTPVFSATDGYVWRIGENNLGGNTGWIIGAGALLLRASGKNAPELKVGDAVTTDTILGYVGTSGNAGGTPPHLHFGVYTAGGAINLLSLVE